MDERNDRPHDLCSSIIFVRNWNACDSTVLPAALVCITCAGYLNSWVIASKDPKIFALQNYKNGFITYLDQIIKNLDSI